MLDDDVPQLLWPFLGVLAESAYSGRLHCDDASAESVVFVIRKIKISGVDRFCRNRRLRFFMGFSC
jgi:hypothetical protein